MQITTLTGSADCLFYIHSKDENVSKKEMEMLKGCFSWSWRILPGFTNNGNFWIYNGNFNLWESLSNETLDKVW